MLAGILAGNLGHVPLVVLDTEIDRSGPVNHAEIRFPGCCPDISNKSVLVVVGELFTGEDLRQGLDFVNEHSPSQVKTATLLTHPAAAVHPDFVGLETPRPLSAPWRISDAYRIRRV